MTSQQTSCCICNLLNGLLLTGPSTIWCELASPALQGLTCAVAYTATVLDVVIIHMQRLLLRNLGNCLSSLLCGQYLALAVTADRENDVYDFAAITQGPILDQAHWPVAHGTMNRALLGKQSVPVSEEESLEHGLQICISCFVKEARSVEVTWYVCVETFDHGLTLAVNPDDIDNSIHIVAPQAIAIAIARALL